MQHVTFAIGSLAVLAMSFFGTLHFLDSLNFQSLDSIRIEHAKSLKAALEKYRAVRGSYPSPFLDNDLADLKLALVDGGFISQLPVDPFWTNGKINKYRYRSDGTMYGLLFYLELGPCQTGKGTTATAPWGGQNITPCPF